MKQENYNKCWNKSKKKKIIKFCQELQYYLTILIYIYTVHVYTYIYIKHAAYTVNYLEAQGTLSKTKLCCVGAIKAVYTVHSYNSSLFSNKGFIWSKVPMKGINRSK